MITKRYRMPFAMISEALRNQVASFESDTSTGITMSGVFIEQDVAFNDAANPEIIRAMNVTMLAAGWEFVEDSPTGLPGLVLLDEEGEERKLSVRLDAVDVGDKPTRG